MPFDIFTRPPLIFLICDHPNNEMKESLILQDDILTNALILVFLVNGNNQMKPASNNLHNKDMIVTCGLYGRGYREMRNMHFY
jgi:hypothetical protein